MSLEVTIPTSWLSILPVSVMGMPEKPCRILASKTSPTVWLGLRTTGSVMKPCSNFCGPRKRGGFFCRAAPSPLAFSDLLPCPPFLHGAAWQASLGRGLLTQGQPQGI